MISSDFRYRFYRLTASGSWRKVRVCFSCLYNPLSTSINIQILQTGLHTFLEKLVRSKHIFSLGNISLLIMVTFLPVASHADVLRCSSRNHSSPFFIKWFMNVRYFNCISGFLWKVMRKSPLKWRILETLQRRRS